MKSIYFQLIALVFTAISFNSSSQSCLPAWQYRMPIAITNANAVALNGHQVKILVNTQAIIAAGKMNSDGSDIRMAANCCSPLCYWVESGINTTSTYIWVRTDLNTSATDTVYLYYGNSGAFDASDPKCTFDLYEDFDTTQTSFTATCGAITENYAAGDMQLGWGSNGMMLSDSTFPITSTYTVESDVTAATGIWPGFYWARDSDQKSYGLMINTSQARISLTGSGLDYCSGHNWASPLLTYSSNVGLWSFTWIGTGLFDSNFPTIGAVPCTDALYAKDSDLRLMIGGISSGAGSIDMNWVRVRKYAPITPTFTLGAEGPIPGGVSISASASNLCTGDSVQLDAGAGFLSYAWSTADSVQQINVNSAGTYTIIAADAAGCSSTDSITIGAYLGPTAGFSSTVIGLDATFTNGSANGSTYSWDFGDGNTSTLENPVHSYAIDGAYTVCLTVTGPDGCVDDTCMTRNITTVGLNIYNPLSLSIYPIPTSEVLNIECSVVGNHGYELYTVDGKKSMEGNLHNGLNKIDVSKLPKGVYIIRLSDYPDFNQRIIKD